MTLSLGATATAPRSARDSYAEETLLAPPSPRRAKGAVTPRSAAIEEEDEPAEEDENEEEKGRESLRRSRGSKTRPLPAMRSEADSAESAQQTAPSDAASARGESRAQTHVPEVDAVPLRRTRCSS